MNPDDVDDLEFWRVIEFQEYCLLNPPANELIAAFLEYKPPNRTRRRKVGEFHEPIESSPTEEMAQFVKSWGGAAMSQDMLPAYMQELLASKGLLKIKQPALITEIPSDVN